MAQLGPNLVAQLGPNLVAFQGLCMDMLSISALSARRPLIALQGFEAWFCIYWHFHAARLV